jgi:uncharacterized protein
MRSFLSSYAYFVIPLAAWLVAQFGKVLVTGFKMGDWNWRYMYRSGGMPSAHATVIVSLCTVLGYRLGTRSPEFGIACIMAAIILYDALNVRHAVGEHALALRSMVPIIFKKDAPKLTLHQSAGHTPAEVGVGILIGILFPAFVFAVT